jgi:hypothetical protein
MDPLVYYASHSPITDPGFQADRLAGLPATIEGLSQAARNVVLHYLGGERAGYSIPGDRLAEINLRFVEKMLARIGELDSRPFSEPRPPEKRLVGSCRDAAVLLCAMARQQGLPARVRVGFATYFSRHETNFYCSHVICEIWDTAQGRWRLVDPELEDELTRQENQIAFSAHDVPRDQFLVGGKAWQLCRSAKANPDHFGVAERAGWNLQGLPFVRGNLIQDLAALNKMELLNWDCWGLMLRNIGTHTPDELELLDRVAALTQNGAEALEQIRVIYEKGAQLKVPKVVNCYSPVGQPGVVSLGVQFNYFEL